MYNQVSTLDTIIKIKSIKMTLINYALDNGLFFYAGFTGIGIALGYSFISSVINSAYPETTDKGI